MSIVIAGGGSIGIIVAEYFMREGSDVVVIESSPKHAKFIQENLDIGVVCGKETDISVLREANIKNARIFLALTDSEEVNIMACALAKKEGVPLKIARLNELLYSNQEEKDALKLLGVDKTINVEENINEKILENILHPGITDIKNFMDGEYIFATFSFGKKSLYFHKKLGDINFGQNVTPLGYSKNSGFMPYDKSVEINDFLYIHLACEKKYFENLYKIIFPKANKINRVMIFGSGYKSNNTCLRLADALKENGIKDITLVQDKPNLAAEISDKTSFPVIIGDPSRSLFSKNENLEKFDAFVAISNNFEKNLFSTIAAYTAGVRYTYSLVKYLEHVNFISSIPLTSFLNPALISANKIIKYHQIGKVISRSIVSYGEVEFVEFIVKENSKLIGKEISKLPFKKSIIVVLKRDGKLIQPDNSLIISENDQILLMLFDSEKLHLKEIL